MAMTGQGPIGKLSGAFRLFVVWIRDSLPSPVFVDLQPFGIMFGCLALRIFRIFNYRAPDRLKIKAQCGCQGMTCWKPPTVVMFGVPGLQS